MASKTVKINDEISLVIYEGTSEIRIIDNAAGKAYVLKAGAIVDNPQPISSFTPPAIPGIGTRTVTEKKPASIFTISQQNIPTLDPGAVIIDQATLLWAQAAEGGFKDNTFTPSVYGWNGSSPTIITANSYGTDSVMWEGVNTDSMVALPAGTDITDTNAVWNAVTQEPLPFSVVSTDVTVTKPTVISIAEIQAIAASSIDFIDFQARIAAL
jgi:hypothetical protein